MKDNIPMKTTLQTVCLLVTLASGPAICAAEADWLPLFNGKDLDGWEQKNGTAKFEVKEGWILGTTVPDSPNSFLCTTRNYGNFELEFEVMVDPGLNSGVQIRSESLPDFKNGRVHGYQVEIAIGGFSGGIYDEARRGKFLNENKPTEAIRALVKKDEWSKYRIRCQGEHIQAWVNDVKVTDLKDEMTKTGFIGLQVHGVGKRTDALQVRWRNIRLRELNP